MDFCTEYKFSDDFSNITLVSADLLDTFNDEIDSLNALK